LNRCWRRRGRKRRKKERKKERKEWVDKKETREMVGDV
jgi:hypothetical protein